jgi:hypothetical protein
MESWTRKAGAAYGAIYWRLRVKTMKITTRPKKWKMALVIIAICAVVIGIVLWQVILPLVTPRVEQVNPANSGQGSTAAMEYIVGDYYRLSYEPSKLSDAEVHPGEVFYADFKCNITCIGNLPVTPSQSQTTTRFTAVNRATGSQVVLNPAYTVVIDALPTKKGDTAVVNDTAPLQFPEGSESGYYDVVADIVASKVKVLFFWMDASGYIPQTSMTIGSVTYSP